MEIVDANVIVRYLLNDHEQHSKDAVSILEKKEVNIPFEVLAEVVYVLEKVYKIPRKQIEQALTILLEYPNIQTNNKDIFFNSIHIYATLNIDFVDSLLVAYNNQTGATIHTFDKKILKLCD